MTACKWSHFNHIQSHIDACRINQLLYSAATCTQQAWKNNLASPDYIQTTLYNLDIYIFNIIFGACVILLVALLCLLWMHHALDSTIVFVHWWPGDSVARQSLCASALNAYVTCLHVCSSCRVYWEGKVRGREGEWGERLRGRVGGWVVLVMLRSLPAIDCKHNYSNYMQLSSPSRS